MAVFKIINSAKVFKINECLKLKPSTNYSDSIIRDTNYSGQSSKEIVIVNSCNHEFDLNETTLFTDNSSGGSFRAYIKSVHVNNNETKRVPVWYSGIMKNPASSNTYSLSLHGSTANYQINITDKDLPPIAQDVTLTPKNRVDVVINKSVLKYSDPNPQDRITHVKFEGDTSKLFKDSSYRVPYPSGEELPIEFTLYFKAPDVDQETTYQVNYKVKSNGVWSS